MNAADAIAKAKTKKRLGTLVGKKDRTLGEANELIDLMVGYLVQHGSSILDIRDRMATQEGAIEMLADMVAPKGLDNDRLVGLEPPELVGFDTKRKPN